MDSALLWEAVAFLSFFNLFFGFGIFCVVWVVACTLTPRIQKPTRKGFLHAGLWTLMAWIGSFASSSLLIFSAPASAPFLLIGFVTIGVFASLGGACFGNNR
jgi:predicted membrane channel-forming protein YqfA (hemolysin III family)